jgi:hypothetical protein
LQNYLPFNLPNLFQTPAYLNIFLFILSNNNTCKQLLIMLNFFLSRISLSIIKLRAIHDQKTFFKKKVSHVLLYYKNSEQMVLTKKKSLRSDFQLPNVRCQTARSFCGNDLVQVRNWNPRSRASTSSGLLIELAGGVREGSVAHMVRSGHESRRATGRRAQMISHR